MFLSTLWRRGLILFSLVLGLARLVAAQAPTFDMAVSCGIATSAASTYVYVHALTSDSQGNTLVAGDFFGSVSFGGTVLSSPDGDAFVAKRSASGSWLWAVSGGGRGYDSFSRLTVDALGQVYAAGYFGRDLGSAYAPATFGSTTLTSTGGSDALVAKLDGATGQWLWAASAGAGTANGTDEVSNALALDALGGLLLLGSFKDFRLLAGPFTLYQSGTGANLFVAKLNSNTGTWQWAISPGAASSYDLAVDGQGNSYLSGYFYGTSLTLGSSTITNPRASSYIARGFIAKLDATANWVWATAMDNTPGTGTGLNGGGAFGAGMAVDGQDHLYLCGSFGGATATFGATILSNASTTYQGPGIGSVQLSDAFVARLSASTGTWQWAVRAGGVDGESLDYLALNNGRLVVSGSFGRSANMFDPGTPSSLGSTFGTTTLVSAGKYDVVLAGLSTSGTWEWAVRAGSADSDYIAGLTTDVSGRAQIVTWCGAAAQFGSFSVASGYNILARLAGGILTASRPDLATHFALYPNPAHSAVTINGLPANEPVQVSDMLGRLVLTTHASAQGKLELSLPSYLASGIYVVQAAGQARQLAVE